MSPTAREIRKHKREIYFSVLRFLLIIRKVYKLSKSKNREKIRELAEENKKLFYELGPTFIKFGQLLSSRGDMFPQEYIDVMSGLQDIVPPAPFDEIKREIEEEYKKPMNEMFDIFEKEPIFSASLGQVHIASIKGEKLVVKVLRPGVRKRVELDLSALKTMERMFRMIMGDDFAFMAQKIISSFEKTIYDEMDYRKEAKNLIDISNNLLSRERDLRIPKVYVEYVTEKVLPMEYIPGIKITDVEKLKEKGHDLKMLARRVVEVFTTMVIKDNKFHADPHPGNIYVDDDGNLILYDYGMVGVLDRKTRRNLFLLYDALISKDAERIIDAMIKLDALDPYADRYVIKQGIMLALRSLEGEKITEYEINELVRLANRIFFEFPFRLPDTLTLFMRMYLLMEGVALTLDPEFNMLEVVGDLLNRREMRYELYMHMIDGEIENIENFYRKSLSVVSKLDNYIDLQVSNIKRKETEKENYWIPASIIVASAVISLKYIDFGAIGFLLSGALFLYFYFKK